MLAQKNYNVREDAGSGEILNFEQNDRKALHPD